VSDTYLNGVKVEINLNVVTDPQMCRVGQALSKILSQEPSIQKQPEYILVNDLHLKQHQIVQQVLTLSESE